MMMMKSWPEIFGRLGGAELVTPFWKRNIRSLARRNWPPMLMMVISEWQLAWRWMRTRTHETRLSRPALANEEFSKFRN